MKKLTILFLLLSSCSYMQKGWQKTKNLFSSEQKVVDKDELDKDVSLSEIESFAKGGNAKSQRTLGIMYYEGWDAQKDYKQAHYWLKKAARAGDTIAQRMTGITYFRGHGIKKDYKKAVYWFKKAQKSGDKISSNMLSIIYEKGLGVNKAKMYKR